MLTSLQDITSSKVSITYWEACCHHKQVVRIGDQTLAQSSSATVFKHHIKVVIVLCSLHSWVFDKHVILFREAERS